MMSAKVLSLGLNHHTAPVTLRERFAFSETQIPEALALLRQKFQSAVKEAAILSTCNRTEIYCAVAEDSIQALSEWFAEYFDVPYDVVAPYLYRHTQDEAVRHAFRVASGLDSMVLGEPQILGQLKSAIRTAEQQGTLGTLLHQLFQRSFSTAKAVRSQTAIGKESVSMAAAAVRLAQQVFGELHQSDVLCIGAGEMIELCATHFSAHHPKSITIANRTIARAEQLAHRFNAHTLTLATLSEHIERFDVIISCTASTMPILGLGLIEKTIQKRRHRPIVMIDLAVPRDIEPEVARLNDVYLYTVDDLGHVIQQSHQVRQAAVVQAEAIIETQVQAFSHWLQSRKVVPTILRMQAAAQEIQAVELERAKKSLAKGDPIEEVLERLARGITQKHLHVPFSHLHHANDQEREQLLQTIQQLFPQHPLM